MKNFKISKTIKWSLVETKKEIELLQEKISRISVQQIEDSEKMKEEAESLKEALDTKNKMLTASIAESEKLKRIAGI